MKKYLYKFSICITIALMSASSIFAQTDPMPAPEGLIYQAEARDASGKLLTNKELNVKLIITEDSYSGLTVWEADYTVYTDKYGLFSLIIGEGESYGYVFSEIDWNLHEHFLTVQILIEGMWFTTGQLQFLSVPYAFYAGDAGHAQNADFAETYNETDPVFSLSPSATITEGDKTNWNDAHSWGDHGKVGYLTDEVDGNVTNELQSLILAGDILKISKDPDGINIDLSKYNPLTETQVEEYVANNIPSGYLPYKSFFGQYLTQSILYQGGNGNIGVGNPNPSARLHVIGDMRSSTDIKADRDVYADAFKYNTSVNKTLLIPGYEGYYNRPFPISIYEDKDINLTRFTTPDELREIYFNVHLPVGAVIERIMLYLKTQAGTTNWYLIQSEGDFETTLLQRQDSGIGDHWTSPAYPNRTILENYFYTIKINHNLTGHNYIRAIRINYRVSEL